MDLILASKQRPPFHFLGLPPELRNQIYADILTTTYKICRPLQWYYPAAAGLTILRVSKLVYQEARQILYHNGTFSSYIPLDSPQLYQDLRAKSLTDFMQNVTLDLEDLTPYGYPDYPESLRSANSFLKCFSDPAIPRVRCTVFLWPNSNKFLSEVSFLDSLGKLTTFKTIILTHCGGMHSVRGPTSKSLDEYLSVMLGPAQHSFEVHDWRFERTHRLIYHPRRHASGMTGKETTG